MPEAIELFREKIKRRAVVMEIGGFRPTDDPKASWFGRVAFGYPSELWPETVDNRPMVPLAQINTTELPFRPHRLDDVEFLTVFIDPDNPGRWDEKEMWCLRTYPSLNRLVPLTSPVGNDFRVKAFQMRPTVIEEDYPVYDDIAEQIPEGLGDSYIDDFDNTSGFKLGGWPTLIQSEIFWAPFNKHPAKPEFVFQIDSTTKGNWSWGDRGVGYFGRGTAEGHRDEWALTWQCF